MNQGGKNTEDLFQKALNYFKRKYIQEIIEGVPILPYETRLIEATLLLDLYYAVLVLDDGKVIDILTRNDILTYCLE